MGGFAQACRQMPPHCLFELNQSISQQESITALTEDQARPTTFENRFVRVVLCPEWVSASCTQLVFFFLILGHLSSSVCA